MAYLAISHPHQPAQRVSLDQDTVIIGRDDDVDIRLESAKVSRRHARIFLQAGCHWVEDLGSINGVGVDGNPIGDARKLTPGCTIQVGDFELVYNVYEPSDAITYFLVGLDPPFSNEKFVLLPRGELHLGRTPENAVVIPDASLSRTHARLTVTADTVRITDMDSSNGVFVNGKRVHEAELRIGDRISLGSVHLRLAAAGRSADKARALRLGLTAGVIGSAVLIFAALWLQPGLLRDWRLLLGQGRVTEASIERTLQEELKSAQQHAQQRNWQAAAELFAQVLEQDPINRVARVGLDTATTNMQDQERLQRAQTALEQKHWEEAFTLASDVTTQSTYWTKANEIITHSQEKLLTEWLTQGRTTCQHEDWRSCHLFLSRHLAHRPDHTEAQALANLAELGMQQRGIAFVTWQRAGDGWRAAQAALLQMYPDPNVRQAALIYAAGDIGNAQQKAQRLTQKAGGATLTGRLKEIAGLMAQTNSPSNGAVPSLGANSAWERVQQLDAQMIPPAFANVYRERIRAAVIKSFVDAGEAAFDRGLYAQAFAHWQEGLKRDPNNNVLISAISRLESRAKALLDSLSESAPGTTGAPPCQQWQEIINMTSSQSMVNQQAMQRYTGACKKR